MFYLEKNKIMKVAFINTAESQYHNIEFREECHRVIYKIFPTL